MGIREWLQRQPREPQLTQVQAIEFDECDELVAAVGEASYQDALRHICGSDRWEHVRCEVRAVLVPEPSNPYDPNAVMVQVDGQLVGYLSRGDAVEYQPVTRTLFERGEVIVCDARICGRGPGSDTPNLGIFLELPSPDSAMDEVEEMLSHEH
ncbi:MAG TPA: HIRAN domain-containing protein [Thermoleophilaceae bacterium]|nr:HIRAN domain-containing protein [Thermoleophilaceae bacterium]